MAAEGEHNKWIALALCILLGYLGIHVVDAIIILFKPTNY